MSTHYFHYKRSLVRVSCANNSVYTLDDAMQRRVGADCHIRSAEIIVDRAYHSHDVQVFVPLALLDSDVT